MLYNMEPGIPGKYIVFSDFGSKSFSGIPLIFEPGIPITEFHSGQPITMAITRC